MTLPVDKKYMVLLLPFTTTFPESKKIVSILKVDVNLTNYILSFFVLNNKKHTTLCLLKFETSKYLDCIRIFSVVYESY